MTYGHAERNLALIRQVEAETRQLLERLDQPDAEQSAWLREITASGDGARKHVRRLGGPPTPRCLPAGVVR